MIADALRVLSLSTLASGAAIVLILLLRKPLRQRFGAQAAYALWALVPIAALVALLPAPVAPVAAPTSFVAAAPATVQTLPSTIAAAPSLDPMPWLGAAWLLGVGICLFVFLRQQRRFVRALGSLSANADRTFRAQTTAGCPALVGAWRPRIVLPADFEHRYDSAERALILAHERTHRARGDAQLNALAAALRCLHWFNPLFHFAGSRFRFDQELACDAAVIARFPEARRSYADAMLKTQLADLGLPAGCHWQSSHPLKERIAMLKKPLPGRARAALGLGLVAALVVGGSYAAWAAQPAQSSVTDADAPVAQRIHADVVLSVDGSPLDASWDSHSKVGYFMQHDGKNAPSDWDLGLVADHPFFLQIHRGNESWRIDGTVRPAADHTFQIESTLTHNGSVVSRPKLIANSNQPAAIKIGDEKDGKFAGFGAQFTFRDAKPPIAEVKQAQPESDSAAQVSYRRLTRIDYPQSAIAAKAQGLVYIGVKIGADGKVADAKVNSVMPMARTDLADAALTAVKTWTFEPRKVDGKPVASDTTVSIVFSLDPKKPLAVEPGVLDAIRVSPPLADLEPSVRMPLSEDVEFSRMHPPKYPAAALKAREHGEVMLKVQIDERGNPVEALVVKTDPPDMSPEFGSASIAAAMQWKFNPARKDGSSIAGWVQIPVTFSLTEK